MQQLPSTLPIINADDSAAPLIRVSVPASPTAAEDSAALRRRLRLAQAFTPVDQDEAF